MRLRDFAANWLGVIGILAFFPAWELTTRFAASFIDASIFDQLAKEGYFK